MTDTPVPNPDPTPTDSTEPVPTQLATEPSKEQTVAIPDPGEPAPPADDLGQYETFGNETLDSIVTVLKESKVHAKTAGELFKTVVESGDPTKLDLAELTKLVGKDKAVLISASLKSFYATEVAKNQAVVNSVYNTLGSKENWEKVRDWAKDQRTKDPSFNAKADTLNQMLQLSEHSAALAAQELKRLYEASNTSLGITMTDGDKPGSQAPTGTLTRAEYNKALNKARANRDDAEIQRLNAIRAASIQAGI